MKIRLIIAVLLSCSSYYAKAIIYRHDVPLSAFTTLAKADAFKCVGAVYDISGDTNRLVGSCVLIDKNYVLTAWHVFNYGKDFNEKNYRVVFNAIYYTIENKVAAIGETSDIVALRLVEDVMGVVPAVITADDIALPGDTVTMVGYGAQRPSNMLSGMVDMGIKTAAQNTIDSLGGIMPSDKQIKLYADFDGPMFREHQPLPLEGMLNGGDSGGGMFVFKNEKWYLAGIASGSTVQMSSKIGFHGSTMFWSNIAAYHGWIGYAMASMNND